MTEHQRWLNDRGDQILRYDYPINHKAIVFDLGGYEGQWSKNIWKKFEPTIYIFEPVQMFYDIIQNDSACSPFKKYNAGLGAVTEKIDIHISKDGSSLFNNDDSDDKETIQILNVEEFLSENLIDHIDLIKINIEGAEYDLLDKLIEINFLSNIDHLQIQFHPWVDNYQARRKFITDKLTETHVCKYNYDMVWESWSKK